jgi:sulfite reductase (ferredoxin)
LPRKFKVTVAVPGDNSVDLYVDDIGLVVIMDEADPSKVRGYNITVGGGMGRAHGKDETMPLAAEHLGFVEAKDMLNVVKSILCVQRDYGRRDDRKMSRFKYVVAEKGIHTIRELVEKYSCVKIQPWVKLPPWEYKTFLGWHEQGDGKWFYGMNINTGRIKDEGDVR